LASRDNDNGGFDDAPARRLTAEEQRRQRIRSVAIAWFLVALVVLFFLVTIVKLGGNVANRPI
jgi:fatty acid desaturase